MHKVLGACTISVALSAASLILLPIRSAHADDLAVTIKDHKFEPAELHVPAGKQVTLRVTNQDPTPEEFESDDFDAEKVIPGGQSAVIRVGPLDAGRYEFYGEYHEDSAKGALVAE
jgi:plastocyanin